MKFQLTRKAVTNLISPSEMFQARLDVFAGNIEILGEDHFAGMSRATARVNSTFVEVELSLGANRVNFKAHCDADPGDLQCRHIAALLAQLTEDDYPPFIVSDEGRPGSSDSRDGATLRWRSLLDRLLPSIEEAANVQYEPLGLLIKVEKETGYRGSAHYKIAARPARRGSRSPWVQTGVSWRNLHYDGHFDPLQRQAVLALERLSSYELEQVYGYDYGWAQDWISIERLPGVQLLEVLERIRESGVTLVNAASARKPIEFTQIPARGEIDLRRTETGLSVTASLIGPEGHQGALLPCGLPPTLALVSEATFEKSQTISIAKFDPPISSELVGMLGHGDLAVPAEQVPEFEQKFLSRMRKAGPLHSGDGSYHIPQPARPVLQVLLDSAESPLQVSYRWFYSDHGARQRDVEQEILASIEDKLGGSHPLGRPVNGLFPSAELDKSASIEFVVHLLPLLREHPDVQVEELIDVPDYRLNRSAPQVSVTVGESSNDWFDLGITVHIDDREVPFVQLFAALNAGETYLELENREVVRIDAPEFQQLRTLIEEAGELAQSHHGGVRMHKLSIDWWQELLDLGIIEAQQNDWLRVMGQLVSGEQLQELQVPHSFNATLRDYQQQGASWLHFLRRNSLGGLLADDMGLGKTVQILAALEAARLEDPERKFLVVAPTSVAGNWANEASRFAPQMRTALLSETSKKRGLSVPETVATADDAQLIITSYAVFRLDFESFQELDYAVLVLDEAQQLKNHTSKGYKQARELDVPCKFVVTGTPVENNLVELWALVSLAAPGLLGGLKAFKDNYAKQIGAGDKDRLQRLRKRLRPFVLRRTKDQVAADLPAKTEQILEVELDPAHRKAYDRRFQRVRQEILGLVDDVDSNRFKILQSLTLLRQLALDPSLVDEGDAPSAKLQLLRELLSDAVAEGHKVLIFSQFTGFLSKARDAAQDLGIEHGYLDGSTGQKKRKQLIDGFSQGDFPVFFISLKAGGFGINLTSADYCILLDPWWNPAVEAQAVDRVHRIGQTRPVYVYRLVANDTIESKVLALQEKKTQLFNDVLGAENEEAASAAGLSADDFLELIR
ncbi:DEAD/DEAH box helicase [Glutamicibacter creatinolyticus]|uniref:DEAD/DEAH box helicase n=1 Tax=Glutamicibacter creatinolyticus TaxID=162496 RepID=UPI0031D1F60F